VGAQIHDYAAISAYYLGMNKKAIEHAKNALELAPDDLRLQNNLLLCQAGDVSSDNAGVP
jgi:hypothetical protein